MSRIAFYTGSFDPPTFGHLEIIKSSLKLVDHLILGIGIHPSKQPLFSFDERVNLFQAIISDQFLEQRERLEIMAFDGLLVEKARESGASMIIRGLRDTQDFGYEMQLAGMNKTLIPDIETIFIPAKASLCHLNSTLVRQIAALGGDVTSFVPEVVKLALHEKFCKSERT